MNGLPLGPVTEPMGLGAVITEKSHDLLKKGQFNNVPIMIGHTSLEAQSSNLLSRKYLCIFCFIYISLYVEGILFNNLLKFQLIHFQINETSTWMYYRKDNIMKQFSTYINKISFIALEDKWRSVRKKKISMSSRFYSRSKRNLRFLTAEEATSTTCLYQLRLCWYSLPQGWTMLDLLCHS